MPPRLSFWRACRSLALRPRSSPQWQQPRLAAARSFSDGVTKHPAGLGEEMSHSPLTANNDLITPPEEEREASSPENTEVLRQLELMSHGLDPFDPAVVGHKFGIPETPWEKEQHLKNRYDPVLTQITRLLMRDGKLSKAQRDMALILNHLRTSPAPKYSPLRPLLPGAPPSSHLPLNPIAYLTLALDSVAPLIRVRAFAGLAGGGASLMVPQPLAVRERRRQAFKWLLDTVEKKPSRGSGRKQFPARVAEEVIAIVEGKSSLWDKRQIIHKSGTAARANLMHSGLRKR